MRKTMQVSKTVVVGLAVVVLAAHAVGGEPGSRREISVPVGNTPYPPSPVIKNLVIEPRRTSIGNGDNWPITWGDDGDQYTVYCDGKGFGGGSGEGSMCQAKITGSPSDFSGRNIESGSGRKTGGGPQGRKASGMLMVDGVLYMWVRNLKKDGTGSSLAWSKDKALTWTWATWSLPDVGYPVWLNAGQDYRAARDEYAYFYSPDTPSAYRTSDHMLMGRVPKEKMTERNSYRFFAGLDGRGKPSWTADFKSRKPVFCDPGHCYRPDVVFNPAVKRYLLCTATSGAPKWCGTDEKYLGIFDAPNPWGPWTVVKQVDGWGGEENRFQPRIPSKWISPDGESFHLLYSCFPKGPYQFNVQECVVELAQPRAARPTNEQLAKEILANKDLPEVLRRARAILKTGFNAGEGYGEVWIRDLATFIEISCDVCDRAEIRKNLLMFFRFQGDDGNIIDGFIPASKANVSYRYIRKPNVPDFLGHKNTVETDQESSLVQAVYRYVRTTGDRSILDVAIDGRTVVERMEFALEFLLKHRYSKKYGLLWGATTADWGDVQPEHKWGVVLDESSHKAIDIYDNAMFLVAVSDYLSLVQADKERVARWSEVRRRVRRNVQRHLWDAKNGKFVPHLYLDGSPFPEDFDERQIYYHGGTAVAIQAGLLSREEIVASLARMTRNVERAGAASIGLTVYPPYPKGFFKNPSMGPYSYQNGGDWTWFGARMIQALIDNGLVEEAYREILPMVERVQKNNGFYEWYSVENKPRGSGTFRGSAGVLGKAVEMLLAWAENNTGSPPALAIAPQKQEDRVSAKIERDRAILSVTSPSGIGAATIRPLGGSWPATIVVHLHLPGLESFTVSDGKTRVAVSVQSHGANRILRNIWKAGRETRLKPGSPYWMDVGVFDAGGAPIQGLPKKGGYFEIRLPSALLQQRPKSLTLRWIDFYRG